MARGLPLLFVALSLLPGCPPPGAPDAGAPDAGPDDAGQPAADGGPGPGDLPAGAACLVANDLCGPDLVCAELYAGAGGRCWPSCSVAGPCAGRDGEEGACVTGPDGASLCAVTAENLEPCGDAALARCEDGLWCAFLDEPFPAGPAAGESPAGYCVRPCDPDEPATCAQDTVEGCGCTEALPDCSTEGLRLAHPLFPDDEDRADGVCVPPTEPGDSCGTDPATGARLQCSPGQRCAATDGGPGGCVLVHDQG